MTEGSADHREAIAECIDKESKFYSSVCHVVDLLAQVREKSDGHGSTWVVTENLENLEELLAEAAPFNGKPHSIYEKGLADLLATKEKREIDGASIIDENNMINCSGIFLPMEPAVLRQRYGIPMRLVEFLGYHGEKGAKTRTISAWYASDKFGSYTPGQQTVIITLGENHPGTPKPEINVYFCGDRIYCSNPDRQIHWESAASRPIHHPIELEEMPINRERDYKHSPQPEKAIDAYTTKPRRAAAGE